MPAVHLLPASEIPPAALHAAFSAAFADYLIGPFKLALDQWPRFLARQGIALAHSRVATGNGGIQAFALAAPRSDQSSWRLGTMGALPAARGSGAAPALLDDFMARARADGRAQVELECFAQNERGVRLYRSRGFEEVSPLHGWQGGGRGSSAPGASEGVEPVSLDQAFEWIDRVSRSRGDLPLQVTPASLRAQPMALQAWRCGSAQLVAGESAPAQLTICCLLDEDPAQVGAERLVHHLMHCFPAHAIQVPQLQRDDLGGRALQRAGFQKQQLFQLLMRRPL
jgi:GNAT superfamily N-acetyltransferase